MIVLSGADVVLPDRVLTPGSVVIDQGRIVEVEPGSSRTTPPTRIDLSRHYIVPGFVDVHIHGIGGVDVLDGSDSIGRIAERLPRHGVTAFCPTTIACPVATLRSLLAQVHLTREKRAPNQSRVLPAHLESNFLNPEYRGAQPLRCLCRPPQSSSPASHNSEPELAAHEVLDEIERSRREVGIVTLAPELPHGLDLVRRLARSGIRVSLGHSAATVDEGLQAIAEGARHATHLFNRMPPAHHREPGLAGAVLASENVAVELICDGVHVHPAMLAVAIAAKTPDRVMAITDGTAGTGLPQGSRARLGDQTIVVGDHAAHLEDGTLAGSVQTMDRAFKLLVEVVGLSLVNAVRLCSTTPARQMGLEGHGVIAPGAIADLTVLGRGFQIAQTYIGGELAYSAV